MHFRLVTYTLLYSFYLYIGLLSYLISNLFFYTMAESPPFHTLALQSSAVSHVTPHSQVKLQEYHHLLKMKKVLAETQQKMENRINLFKKASLKNLKHQQLSCKAFFKVEAARQKPLFLKRIQSRKDLRTESANNHRRPKDLEQEDSGVLAQRLQQQKLENARKLKEEKSRLRVIVRQQRTLDLERKLASANGVRQGRNNAKQARQMLQQERRENHQRQIFEKYEREKEAFLHIEKQLACLQLEEEEALLSWKRTLEEKH